MRFFHISQFDEKIQNQKLTNLNFPSYLDFSIQTSGPLAWIEKSNYVGEMGLQKIWKSNDHFSLVKFSVSNWNEKSSQYVYLCVTIYWIPPEILWFFTTITTLLFNQEFYAKYSQKPWRTPFHHAKGLISRTRTFYSPFAHCQYKF